MSPFHPSEGGLGLAPRRFTTAPTCSPFSSCLAQRLFVGLVALTLAVMSLPALAQTSRPELCEAAAREASDKTGVPLSVLRAIMLTVSGRKSEEGLVPWPWTVGAGGQRVWFETADDARAYAYQQIKANHPVLGLGCFQIDYAKYGPEFASLEDMLTPRVNAEFAASLLLSLQARTGGWGYAAAALQGLEPAAADAWLTSFNRHRETLRDDDFAIAGMAQGDALLDDAPRLNTYPLLQDTGEARVLGSLVPVGPLGPGASLFPSAEGL